MSKSVNTRIREHLRGRFPADRDMKVDIGVFDLGDGRYLATYRPGGASRGPSFIYDSDGNPVPENGQSAYKTAGRG